MLYAVLSDIHGNLPALKSVFLDMSREPVKGVILLGDLIDYGMQSNEVADYIDNHCPYPLVCNIWGNHERAILLRDYSGFSSERGEQSARHTASILSQNTIEYLRKEANSEGKACFLLNGRKYLAVHASLEDPFWHPISPEDVRGDYSAYDVVFSGHSHLPHVFLRTYKTDNKELRDKHAVTFINPGSVGQPRNQNPRAQYALFDDETMTVSLRGVPYPVEEAMALFDGSVDWFYRDRLKMGV